MTQSDILANKNAKKTSVVLIIACLVFVSGCQKNTGTESISPNSSAVGAKAVKLNDLNLSVTEDDLKKSSDSFEFFPGGHFGEKTQYNGKSADEIGGALSVHCRSGKPFSIEAKYHDGIPRELAMKKMQKLLPANPGEVIEHDDDDRIKKDCKQAAEFFYYKSGPYSELLYAENSSDKVVQINVWTKNG